MENNLPDHTSVHPQVYMVDLEHAAREIKQDMFMSNTAHSYINTLRQQFENTYEYKSFHNALLALGGQALAETMRQPEKSRAELINFFICNQPIRDGFLLGLAANNHLMAKKSANPADSPLDSIGGHTATLLQQIRLESSTTKSRLMYLDIIGNQLYRSNIAHPDEPNAEQANDQENPFDFWVDSLTSALYDDHKISSPEEQKASEDNTARFRQGFGLARYSYNAYRLQLTQNLNDAYYSTATEK